MMHAPIDTATRDTSDGPRKAASRDVRLDVFRGLGMLIIFVAHSPGNPWVAWIPARFGFSSATELFVFCSGFASALAFGRTFEAHGMGLGTARIAKRMWEVYRAHIGLFVALAALAAAARGIGMGEGYWQEHVAPIARDATGAILGLVTLTWMPPWLDILPIYLVILACVPLVMAVRRLHRAAPFGLVAVSYLAVQLFGINLPGNPWNGAGWYFNPFAWQLIFFLGYFFGMGWLKPPRWGDARLVLICLLVVTTAVPVSFWAFHDIFPALADLHEWLLPGEGKTGLHPLRVVHFLATAYLALSVIDHFKPDLRARGGRHLVKVGQQSLISFLLSMVFARIAGLLFEMAGTGALSAAMINIGCLALIIACAWIAGWFKSNPWSRTPPHAAAAASPR